MCFVISPDSYRSLDKIPDVVRQLKIQQIAVIQPNGGVNFCVDFPDYVIGNVRNSSLEEIWNSKKANKFREYLEKKPLPICFRCGAQYMSG